MKRKVGKGTTRVRSKRARKIYWERRGILESGLTLTPSETTISSVDSEERPASYKTNPKESAEWRYPLPHPSNFFDHEEPSDDSDDSDFIVLGESGEETDEVGSSATEESVHSDDEYPSLLLQDLIGDGLLRQGLEEINNERIKQYEAWARREMPPGAEERLKEWDEERLEEWERSIKEPRPRREHRTREHSPGDQLVREEPRPQQRLRLVLKPRKQQILKLRPPKLADSPGNPPDREDPRPQRSLKRHHSPDDLVLEEPRPRQRLKLLHKPRKQSIIKLREDSPDDPVLEEPRPRQSLKLLHKPRKQSIIEVRIPTREDSPDDPPVREDPRPQRVPKRKLSPGDQLALEEPRPRQRRRLEPTPSDQLILELERHSVTPEAIKHAK